MHGGLSAYSLDFGGKHQNLCHTVSSAPGQMTLGVNTKTSIIWGTGFVFAEPSLFPTPQFLLLQQKKKVLSNRQILSAMWINLLIPLEVICNSQRCGFFADIECLAPLDTDADDVETLKSDIMIGVNETYKSRGLSSDALVWSENHRKQAEKGVTKISFDVVGRDVDFVGTDKNSDLAHVAKKMNRECRTSRRSISTCIFPRAGRPVRISTSWTSRCIAGTAPCGLSTAPRKGPRTPAFFRVPGSRVSPCLRGGLCAMLRARDLSTKSLGSTTMRRPCRTFWARR